MHVPHLTKEELTVAFKKLPPEEQKEVFSELSTYLKKNWPMTSITQLTDLWDNAENEHWDAFLKERTKPNPKHDMYQPYEIRYNKITTIRYTLIQGKVSFLKSHKQVELIEKVCSCIQQCLLISETIDRVLSRCFECLPAHRKRQSVNGGKQF